MESIPLFKGVNKIVVALSFARFADALGNSILVVLLPVYIASSPPAGLPWNETFLISIVISAYGLINTILQPLVGVATDRIKFRKPLIILGLILMGAGTLAYIFTDQYFNLLGIRIIQGIGVSLTVPASLTLISSSTSTATRGRTMGFYSTLRLIGFAIGPLVGGFLQLRYGFNTSFFVGAGAILFAALLVQIWVHESPAPEIHKNPRTETRLFDPSIWNKGIISLGAAMFMMACAYSLLGTLENEFNARLQQTVLGFGIASSALTVSRMLVQSPLGYLSDKIGRKPLIIIGLIAMAPATVLMGLVTSTAQLALTRALQGITSAAIASPALALVGDLSTPEGEGRQMSVVTTGFFLGITIGPLLAGVFSRYAFSLPFILAGILLLIGALIVKVNVPDQIDPGPNPGDML